MKLFGTTTSPYVRRVRVVAKEIGCDPTWFNTATESGQTRLRDATPIWKIPVLELDDGKVLFDSHVIIEYLFAKFGTGKLRPLTNDAWAERNVMTAADAALDSAIQSFYIRRDSPDLVNTPFVTKNNARVESIMTWLDAQLTHGPWITKDKRVGLSEVCLQSVLDWMVFREVYPVARHERLAAFQEAHSAWPGFVNTYPRVE